MESKDSIREDLWYEIGTSQARQTEAWTDMSAAINNLKDIKPFPLVVRKVLSLMQNPTFEVHDVTRVIEEDPSLAASVLRVANSALFSGSAASKSIQQAIVRLGANMLREVIVSAAVSGLFRDVGGIGKTIRDHSACVAALSKLLADHFAPDHQEGLFEAGLLHDVGKLLLLQLGMFDYGAREVVSTIEPDKHAQAEKNTLGFDHAVLAANVLWKWNVPDPLPQLVALHHQPQRAYQMDGINKRIAILRLADQLEPLIRNDESLNQLSKAPELNLIGIEPDQIFALRDEFQTITKQSQTLFGA